MSGRLEQKQHHAERDDFPGPGQKGCLQMVHEAGLSLQFRMYLNMIVHS